MTIVCAKELGKLVNVIFTYIFPFHDLLPNGTILCRHGIRCNAILPGFIETPLSAAVPQSRLDEVSVSTLFQLLLVKIIVLPLFSSLSKKLLLNALANPKVSMIN